MSISLLTTWLQKHFAYEEDNLLPVLGDCMMKGLLAEHQAIRKEIESINEINFSTISESDGRDKTISQKLKLQQAILNLADSIEKHAWREEIVLDIARKGLGS